MSALPHALIHNILEFLFSENEMVLFKDVDLELEDAFTLNQKSRNQEHLLKELFAKTSFWRIKWLNKEMDIGSSGDDDDDDSPIAIKFNSSRAQLTFITEYWNYHYPNYHALLPLENKQNCEEEFITDERKSSKKIFNNIKMLKSYIWNDKHNGLFKPGINCKARPVWMSHNTVVMEGDL